MKILTPAALVVLFAACGVETPTADPGTPTQEPTQQTQFQPTQQQQEPLTGFPCDVRSVLQSTCAGCHAQAVYFGSFITRADLVPLANTAHERLSSATQPMPPYGSNRQLTAAERQTLLDWFAAGAPAGACGPLTRQ